MRIDGADDVERMPDPWRWRDGPHPGSRRLQWYPNFEGQDRLHDLAAQAQRALPAVARLSAFPLLWLQLTVAGLGDGWTYSSRTISSVPP